MNTDKRSLHHLLVTLRRLHLWYLLLAAIAAAIVSVYSLRQNNLVMIELREQVFVADNTNGDTEAALKKLREHVYGHMNTNLASADNAIKPPIQLKHRYEQLVQSEKDRVSTANAAVYTAAQDECEKLFPGSFSGGPRVPCVQAYVDSHQTKAVDVPEALYKFDFVSPTWSPDIAGISLAISLVLFSLFLAGNTLERWLRREINS